MIFQDPYGSLNPRRRVGSIIGDPFAIHGVAEGAERPAQVQELMELRRASTPSTTTASRPSSPAASASASASPGRSRCEPKLDRLRRAGVGAGRVDPGADHQPARGPAGASCGLTYVFIAHDLSVVRHVSDRVAVMYLGKIVEVAADRGPATSTPAPPLHGALLSAVPGRRTRTRARAAQRVVLRGDLPVARSIRRRAAGSTRAARRRRSAALAERTPRCSSTRPDTVRRATSRWPTVSCSRCRSPRSTTSRPTCRSTRPRQRRGRRHEQQHRDRPWQARPRSRRTRRHRARGRGADPGPEPWRLAWERLRRDRAAMVSFVVIVLIALVAIGAPLIALLVGHGPNDAVPRHRPHPAGPAGRPAAAPSCSAPTTSAATCSSGSLYGSRISLLVGRGLDAAVGGARRGRRRGRRLLRRPGRHRARAVHRRGALVPVPAARASRSCRVVGPEPRSSSIARDRVLQLGRGRPHRARPDAVDPGAGVRRGGPLARRKRPCGSCSSTCCPTCSRR